MGCKAVHWALWLNQLRFCRLLPGLWVPKVAMETQHSRINCRLSNDLIQGPQLPGKHAHPHWEQPDSGPLPLSQEQSQLQPEDKEPFPSLPVPKQGNCPAVVR